MVDVERGTTGYVDPWVSGFGGRGVPTYVETLDGLALPRAVLPVPDSGDLRSLSEWFSVAGACAARGFRMSVAAQETVVESPPPTVASNEDRMTGASGVAYASPELDLQRALRDVAMAVGERNLPDERGDLVKGESYLAAVRDEFADVAERRFGRTPVLRELAVAPLEWWRTGVDAAAVGVTVRGDMLHFQEGGGDGQLSALDLLLYARSTVSGSGRVVLPDTLMDVRVGGIPVARDDRTEVCCTGFGGNPGSVHRHCESEFRFQEPSGSSGFEELPPHVKFEAVSDDFTEPGMCYLLYFRPSKRRYVATVLGPCPPLEQIVSQPESWYQSRAVLSTVMVSDTRVRDVCHLSFAEARESPVGLTASILLDACRAGLSPDIKRIGWNGVASDCKRAGLHGCVVDTILAAVGPVVLREAATVKQLLDSNVLARWRDSGDVFARRGNCIVPATVGHSLASVLLEMISADVPLCKPYGGDLGQRCESCWFRVVPGHDGRCSARELLIPVSRNEAWIGDAYHQLDVRVAIVGIGVAPRKATQLAQEYVSAESQAQYVREVLGISLQGSDRVASNWFEANYLSSLRAAYQLWLDAELVARCELLD